MHGRKFSGLFLNSGFFQNAELENYNRFSYLYTVCLKTIDHLILKLWIFIGHAASFKIEIRKVQDFGNFGLSPMELHILSASLTIKSIFTEAWYCVDVAKEKKTFESVNTSKISKGKYFC